MVKNKITIVEIAKIAGVNPSTVSRALHPEKSSHLSEELRQKIKKICEGNNYRPQVAAKGFAARKSYRVGLLLGALRNDLTNPHFSLFIQGICDSLQSAGYTLSILWCEADGKENINEKVQNFLFSDVAGIDRSADYLKYRHWYKAGLGMTIGGASLMALGGLTYVGTAVYAIIAGVPLALTGNDMPAGVDIAAWTSVISLIYENKLDDMADEYNSSRPVPSATISFGTQRNGIGLALNF